MYSLTYETLIQILLHLAYSGELRANIPSQLLSRPIETIIQVIYKLDKSGVITWHQN